MNYRQGTPRSAAMPIAICLAFALLTSPHRAIATHSANPQSPPIQHDPAAKTVTLSTADAALLLRLNYHSQCVLDQVRVCGHDVTPAKYGISTDIQVAGQWCTTGQPTSAKVTITGNRVEVADIALHNGPVELTERWTFTVHPDRIVWSIDRQYLTAGTLDDTYFPGWVFNENAWTGALLGTGGVAWFKLFDTPVASYGVHTGLVTFWNKENDACLRIQAAPAQDSRVAVRFSRHPHGVITCNYSVTRDELPPKHKLYRFLRDRQDVWAPFPIEPGRQSLELTLSAHKYSALYDRGTLAGLDAVAIREICSTIARLGVIDQNIIGTNGWYSGFAVLQEQWIAQLGLAIDDPAYTQNYSATLDDQRAHAIGPDGRVKPRWFYTTGDDMPGTYDANGFYECQWGVMLDSQPCFVINVAEQFDFNGDLDWLRRHKPTCEKALDYMLARDSNANGLVEIVPKSHTEKRGGDWLDIVWTAFENTLINAQMYAALTRWADAETLLSDPAQSARYRQAAAKLKATFNRPIAEGGLWDPEHHCYAHWRDQDGSIHGTNLVIPVNFMAIASGLCDDPDRRAAILDQIETQMQRERLFFWPACMFAYADDEGGGGPFPTYENGDIFLGWGEVGTRAYAAYKPEVAVRIIKNVLDRYKRDGLAFQRYLRKTQQGEGTDILSNMANAIVGLYRNIYGLQPKWNRLYLEPHLPPDLAGTKLKYDLRGHCYTIDLAPDDYAITVDGVTLREKRPFAVAPQDGTLQYFEGSHAQPSLAVQPPATGHLTLQMGDAEADTIRLRTWTATCGSAGATATFTVLGLPEKSKWVLFANGGAVPSLSSGPQGEAVFAYTFTSPAPVTFRFVQPSAQVPGLEP